MKKIRIEITLKNGIRDITISHMDCKDVNEVYNQMRELRRNDRYLKLSIDNYIVEYNFEDISLIKIYEAE